jgi:dienelactone hydrolase
MDHGLKVDLKEQTMKNNRRNFLRLTGLAGLGVAGVAGIGMLKGLPVGQEEDADTKTSTAANDMINEQEESLIGLYGPWALGFMESKPSALSFRSQQWQDLDKWRKAAKAQLAERLAMPDIGPLPQVKVTRQYVYDGLHIEELSWQLPYGRPTEAILLKPQNAKGPLPGILAFHDHGGNKYFGKSKITRTADRQHPLMASHQQEYYSGRAWANEMARQGYAVLVSDAFPFASRRVMLQDVPQHLRNGLRDPDPNDATQIAAYNKWAGEHEHVMAKSLFSAGTTWPGVFLAEDQKALDILCARPDVDASRIGCAGLSGGGMRTVFLAGLDPRIKCAVCVGFMTTWKDLILHKSFTHTWMTYVPLLPRELDFPEILGLRTPLPTLVLNDSEDGLFTLPEMQRADKILGEVYKKAGAESHYRCSFHPGPHKFDKKMQTEAFGWFDQWLKAS